jgi:hypothetical protein
MKLRTLTLCLIITCLLALISPIQAADSTTKALYQNSFAQDPKWSTNCPSYYYWDPGLGQYYFSIEPSTGCYAFTPVEGYDGGPFTLEYDVVLNHIDDSSTFRLGFSGADMDPSKGPNVLTEFTNAKNGQIMWLHLVTQGNKMVEVNSKRGDTLSSGPTAYDGTTVKYDLNTTYHVTVNYNADQNILSMKVNNKLTGTEIWGYYVNTGGDLGGMNRIYVGAIGDYGMMSTYAKGYIDNVRLTVPSTVSATPTGAATTSGAAAAATTQRPTALPTTPGTQAPVETTATPQSPLSVVPVLAALGTAMVCSSLILRRKD